jgi:hypothetical protein
MKLLIRNYLQQKEEAPSRLGLGLCLKSEAQVLNVLSKSRESFIEVYINNQ